MLPSCTCSSSASKGSLPRSSAKRTAFVFSMVLARLSASVFVQSVECIVHNISSAVLRNTQPLCLARSLCGCTPLCYLFSVPRNLNYKLSIPSAIHGLCVQQVPCAVVCPCVICSVCQGFESQAQQFCITHGLCVRQGPCAVVRLCVCAEFCVYCAQHKLSSSA
jgi:hypothetical protein